MTATWKHSHLFKPIFILRLRNQSPQTLNKYWLKMNASVSMCPSTLSVLHGVKLLNVHLKSIVRTIVLQP